MNLAVIFRNPHSRHQSSLPLEFLLQLGHQVPHLVLRLTVVRLCELPELVIEFRLALLEDVRIGEGIRAGGEDEVGAALDGGGGRHVFVVVNLNSDSLFAATASRIHEAVNKQSRAI